MQNIPTIPMVSITKLKTFSFIITSYFKVLDMLIFEILIPCGNDYFQFSLQKYYLKKTLHVRSFEKMQKIFIFSS